MSDTELNRPVADILEGDRRKFRRRVRRRVIAGLAVLLLVVGTAAGTAIYQYRHTCGFADGLSRDGVSGECVGVTDGSFVFHDEFAAVEKLIADENRKVLASGDPYVTVAFSEPMTLSPDDPVDHNSVRHSLEGAFVAQWRVNNTSIIGSAPKVRLVLANPGSQGRRWETMVHRLADLTDDSDHLVAVTGLGYSTKETESTIRWLSQHTIAMVGSLITSTELNGANFPGLVRVAPTNADEAAAAIAYLAPAVHTALLVQDRNTADNYVTTLGREFTKRFPASAPGRRLVGQVEAYNSSLANAGNRFAQIADAVCLEKPDVVFFAGRGKLLTEFVKSLGHRHCPDTVRVITGDDGSEVTFDANGEVAAALATRDDQQPVSVVFTGLAHPDQWTLQPTTEGKRGFDEFSAGYQKFFKDTTAALDDSKAMMGHDAVLTATAAIRGPGQQSDELPIPTSGEVIQNFAGLHGVDSVEGASGPIRINGSTGDPINKPMPVLQLKDANAASFVRLVWPAGTPAEQQVNW